MLSVALARPCAVVALLVLGSLGPSAPDFATNAAEAGTSGGRLTVALRAEPKTLNPVFAVDRPTLTLLRRLHADLVHIDRASQRAVPALAKSWELLDDGRRYRVHLRQGLRFSDGDDFDARDVLFTFAVHLDPDVGSPSRSLLLLDDQPLRVEEVSRHTVDFVLPRPYAAGVRLLDGFSILPSHLLEPAYREGRLAEAWGLGAEPAALAGLGPFVLRDYRPGERVQLARNPNYWMLDDKGQQLPYLDELIVRFLPDHESQMLRFMAGELDVIDALTPGQFATLARHRRRLGDGAGPLQDLGPGFSYSFLFFNLNDLDGASSELAHKQTWFRNRSFRKAVSLAVDREAITRLVFRGRATPLATHVSPGDKLWAAQIDPPTRDLAEARRLLRDAGFTRDDSGRLRDASGVPVRIVLSTNTGNKPRLEMLSLIQQDLGELGVEAAVAPLEFRSLLDRVTQSHDYEAVLLEIRRGDADPNPDLNVWLSNGSSRLWHLRRKGPPEPWEREVDDLLRGQMSEIDAEARRASYHRVQRILAREEPVLFLVAPHVLVAADPRLGNFRPALLDHSTLWNAHELYWRPRKTDR